MPRRTGRGSELWDFLLSDGNLGMAIDEVNESHHFSGKHKPNSCTAWVQETKDERIRELRQIIINGFVQKKPKVKRRWDPSAQKWRTISEPAQWPDQYVHHALIQALQPTLMRGMDPYCCGSIRGRGTRRGKEAVERWMEKDRSGTRYEFSGDVYHFYDSLKPEVVMTRMRQLFKDRRVLDLIWRIVKDGVLIGAYPSQWFANTVLQPLDQLIRQSGLCAHYVRYMDNLTATGPNKRKLKKLRYLVDGWLNDHDLRLKGDWQIFRIVGKTAKKPLEAPRRGFERPKRRMPDAMGYRYGRGYTIPRKHNILRLKRVIARYRKRRDAGKRVAFRMANSIISRCGQIKHCSNVNLYRILFKGERILRELKKIVRARQRKESLTWIMYLEQRAKSKSSKPRAAPIPT